MINKRFGSLVVIGDAPPVLQTDGKHKRAVRAMCDCGIEKAFIASNLKNGNSRSCGCKKNSGMRAFNDERSTPQEWTIEGDVAYIFIGKIKVLVDAADVPIVREFRWGMHGPYVTAKGCRLPMHRLILGLDKGDPREADHAHHNCADNRRSELRIANSAQNKMNRRGNVVATSKFKGVHFDMDRRRFVAQIRTGSRYFHLGRFVTEADAARAYNAAAIKLFGSFAYVNPV